jgi:hypothetical protein
MARSSKRSMRRVIARGGSLASNMVMAGATANPKTKSYELPYVMKTTRPYGGTNLYQTTGGGKRKSKRSVKSRKNNSCNKSKKTKRVSLLNRVKKMSKKMSNKVKKMVKGKGKGKGKGKKMMKGGGSDWIASQYSLGPINTPEGSTGEFSLSKAPSMSNLRNPPNMGKAGSGFPMKAGERGSGTGAPVS